MKNKFIGLGVAIGAGVGIAMGGATHQPGVWLPLGIGIGLAIGVAFRPLMLTSALPEVADVIIDRYQDGVASRDSAVPVVARAQLS